MKKYILTILLGSVVGLLGGLQGSAGSLYILTGLLILGIVDNQKQAAGTALMYTSVPLTLSAAYIYYKKGDVDLTVSGILILTGIIFSYFGAKLNYLIPKKAVEYSIFITTFLSSIYFFIKAYNSK